MRLSIGQGKLIGRVERDHPLMAPAMIGVMLKRELAIGALNAPARGRHGQVQQGKRLLIGRRGPQRHGLLLLALALLSLPPLTLCLGLGRV